MVASGNRLMVGMAEIKIATGSANLYCLGLGSCVGLVAYDSDAQVAGLAHIMLPARFPDRPIDKLGKFADTGVAEIVRLMEEEGALRRRIVVAYAGGASVFSFGSKLPDKIDIGASNSKAVEAAIKELGLRCLGFDVGGSDGRSLSLCVKSGEVWVRTVRAGEALLCNMTDA